MRNLFNVIVTIGLLSLVLSCNNGAKQENAGAGNEQNYANAQVGGKDPVNLELLPKAAKDYIDKYLGDKEIIRVKAYEDDVRAWLGSGEQLKFDLDGNFKELECASGIHASIIDERIINDVKSIDHKATIVKIEKDSFGDFEVKLDNGMEVKYDANYHRIGLDD